MAKMAGRDDLRWRVRMAACLGALLSAAFFPISAEAGDAGWQPTKPIIITAPSNPGGGWDTTARFMQLVIAKEALSAKPVEVVNRGGGSGTIALTELVSNKAGDPHEMMVAGLHLTSAALMLASRYSLQDTTPLARLTGEYEVVAVPASSPFETLDDLVQAFRSDVSKISWGGGSAGGTDHIFLALLSEKLGVDPTDANYVAFTGGGEAAAAVMGGQVSAAISGYGEMRGLIDTGRIRLLAISAPDRRVDPGIPTFAELGIDLTFSNWRGVVAAPGLSRSQKAWLLQVVADLHASPLWRDILENNHWQDEFLSGDEFSAFIREDSMRTRRVLGRLGIGVGDRPNASVGAAFFPTMVGIGLLISMGAMAFNAVRRDRKPAAAAAAEDRPSLRLFMAGAGLLAAYILVSHTLGFVYATPAFIVLMSRINGSRNWLRDTVVAVILTAAIVVVFGQLLHVAIP